MTQQQIKEARELCAMTPSGPWIKYDVGVWVAHARTLLPAALDEIDRLKSELARREA